MNESPLLIFANRISGGGLAGKLMDELADEPNIYFVRLPEEASTFQNTYSELLKDQNLKCVVAGGDGSVNWVVSLLSNVFGHDNSNENLLNNIDNNIDVLSGNHQNDNQNEVDTENEAFNRNDTNIQNEVAQNGNLSNVMANNIENMTNHETTQNAVTNPTNANIRSYRPPLAVFPLGTGNDMSRALGWGRAVNKRRIKHIREELKIIREGKHIENVDVWKLHFKRLDSGIEDSKTMMNYFSIGVDAEIAHNFEEFRLGKCGCCICCQCMSLTCYVPVALRSMCGKRPIRNYLTVDVETNNECHIHNANHGQNDNENTVQRLDVGRSEKTLVFQAIPSIYAGRDLWGRTSPRSMSDRKVEVLTEGGVWRLGFAQIGFNTAKPFCQGTKATITSSEPLYYQVDGEGFFVNGPATVTVEREGSYPLIFNK
ncbi:diacylglycerol kinase [Tritrichomonas foetus]|uniref:diacylglycerol kinase (ATP) n=1 Tax=Tritrichomonas foetus TaxID=1144522 RepID=A0A1J4JQ71_9EUKA|nr:diacylglycerol kinase [Tritrichomonas foetus]|eukprot:OHT01265.1 diacylglycerol kinase [Tritrichomonas foetus]